MRWSKSWPVLNNKLSLTKKTRETRWSPWRLMWRLLCYISSSHLWSCSKVATWRSCHDADGQQEVQVRMSTCMFAQSSLRCWLPLRPVIRHGTSFWITQPLYLIGFLKSANHSTHIYHVYTACFNCVKHSDLWQPEVCSAVWRLSGRGWLLH